MTTRRSPAAWSTLILAAVLGGCGGAPIADTPAPVATPVVSPGPALAGTIGRITDALGAAGFRVAPPTIPYRPSEPASLTQVARSVLQVQDVGPEAGYVVVYQLSGSADAAARATELAAYLGSGFGQTNFPVDAQFSVAQLDSNVIMTWWSAARASDPDQARGAFDVVRTIGQPYPVLK